MCCWVAVRRTIALFSTAQALAAIGGRDFALPDDVKRMAVPVLVHRLILKPGESTTETNGNSAVTEIMEDVKVPLLDQQIEEGVDYFK